MIELTGPQGWEGDHKTLELLAGYTHLNIGNIKNDTLELIVDKFSQIYKACAPRLITIHELVQNLFERVGINKESEAAKTVSNARGRSLDNAYKQIEMFDDHYDLEDWNSLYEKTQ